KIRKAARDLIRRLASFYRVKPPNVAGCGRRPHFRGYVRNGIGIVGLNPEKGIGTILNENRTARPSKVRSTGAHGRLKQMAAEYWRKNNGDVKPPTRRSHSRLPSLDIHTYSVYIEVEDERIDLYYL